MSRVKLEVNATFSRYIFMGMAYPKGFCLKHDIMETFILKWKIISLSFKYDLLIISLLRRRVKNYNTPMLRNCCAIVAQVNRLYKYDVETI